MGVKRRIRGGECEGQGGGRKRDNRGKRVRTKSGMKGEVAKEEERGKRGKKKERRGGGALRLDVTCLSD